MVDMEANTLLSCNKLDCARSLRVLQRAPSNNPLRDVSVLTTYRQPDIGRFGPCLTLGDHCQYMCVPFGGQLVGANGKPYRYAPEKNSATLLEACASFGCCVQVRLSYWTAAFKRCSGVRRGLAASAHERIARAACGALPAHAAASCSHSYWKVGWRARLACCARSVCSSRRQRARRQRQR